MQNQTRSLDLQYTLLFHQLYTWALQLRSEDLQHSHNQFTHPFLPSQIRSSFSHRHKFSSRLTFQKTLIVQGRVYAAQVTLENLYR